MSHPVAAGLKGHGNPFCQCSAPFVLADDGTFSILSPERNVNTNKNKMMVPSPFSPLKDL
jgi:hypothetical protein